MHSGMTVILQEAHFVNFYSCLRDQGQGIQIIVDFRLEVDHGCLEILFVFVCPSYGIDGFYLGRGLVKHVKDRVGGVGMFLLPGVCPLLQFGFMCVVRCCHASGLLLLGDGDQGAAGDRPVSPAVVADLLGELIEAQDLAQGILGLADDGPQLLLGVLLFAHQGL